MTNAKKPWQNELVAQTLLCEKLRKKMKEAETLLENSKRIHGEDGIAIMKAKFDKACDTFLAEAAKLEELEKNDD